jgi:hypothetical protein
MAKIKSPIKAPTKLTHSGEYSTCRILMVKKKGKAIINAKRGTTPLQTSEIAMRIENKANSTLPSIVRNIYT